MRAKSGGLKREKRQKVILVKTLLIKSIVVDLYNIRSIDSGKK